jgi:serine/threonine-protein kinase
MTVSVIKGNEYIFNGGLLEFGEINRNIMNSELPSLITVIAVFEENGTIYAVSDYIPGITLEDFLTKNGGILKWEQARALCLPLIDTIKGMNDIGIVHGGISPETIVIGRDGKLRITGYTV